MKFHLAPSFFMDFMAFTMTTFFFPCKGWNDNRNFISSPPRS